MIYYLKAAMPTKQVCKSWQVPLCSADSAADDCRAAKHFALQKAKQASSKPVVLFAKLMSILQMMHRSVINGQLSLSRGYCGKLY